ncbi:hypothetical protein K2X14_12705 [Acetobacter sp. TBRC 12305]|uniref:Uncharacterized protein n=1 Tax=Acetobacter garciniae TaxID=2817435 RepID=A0A939HQL1_9PROT|nr:hypothetical protein [Acetobacter garciniae]MBO1325804.1 hypothetical protein [Acetobacter garciniae]MBX0345704.1 hypothetical protein [Acetobacter garciniae]
MSVQPESHQPQAFSLPTALPNWRDAVRERWRATLLQVLEHPHEHPVNLLAGRKKPLTRDISRRHAQTLAESAKTP